VRLEGPGTVTIADIPANDRPDGEVLLKVQMVGMCGTDLNTFHCHKFSVQDLVSAIIPME
jgi:threonine dehydrogenase-like Zn-dependent dehydrogenase